MLPSNLINSDFVRIPWCVVVAFRRL